MQKNALTVRSKGISNVIASKVSISMPFIGNPSAQEGFVLKEFVAIWDTGATNSVITKKVVDALNLVPTGQTEVHTAGGAHLMNTYLVNITLPGNVMIQGVRVTEANIADGVDVLIGMDIITMGDFSVTNFEGKTVMSFRMPSCCEIDFVPEANIDNEQEMLKGMNRQQRREYERNKRKGKIKISSY